MKVIGIHDGHNATASLLVDGKIKWVIQEERIKHEKNFDGFPSGSIKKILELEGVEPSEIDAVVLNGKHQPKPMSRLERIDAYKNLSGKKSGIKSTLKKVNKIADLYASLNNSHRLRHCENLGFEKNKISFVNHHKAHAATVYYANNNFDDDILVLTNDGSGDRVCATISIGRKGELDKIQEVHEDHSIALMYAMFTFLTGMVPLEHEYKIMGMAPYADMKGARKVADEFHSMFKVSDDGLTWEFIKGESIFQSKDFFENFMYLKRFDHLMAGLQVFVEEFLAAWVKAAIKHTGISKIALSGGIFMNVKANQTIMNLPEVEEVFIFPSCGDESNAIGVAYDYYARNGNFTKIEKLTDVYFGIELTNQEVKSAFDNYSFDSNYTVKYIEDIEDRCAEILAQGNVIARFKGREEFGARSLGNRAILGNPSSPEVIKTINELIKNRDFWMPFASSILDEDIDRYVHLNDKYESFYMIMTYDTKEEAKEIIGGIHPYDKTVRPQLVTKEQNESYWRLINNFKRLTGIGAVLNTSLNLHGLPLVYSPEDAFEVLEKSKLKYLAIENYLITKVD